MGSQMQKLLLRVPELVCIGFFLAPGGSSWSLKKEELMLMPELGSWETEEHLKVLSKVAASL